jgi:hypothetical protein
MRAYVGIVCKCKLGGPCGVFFSEESIKYQNICYECHHQASRVLGRSAHYPVVIATTATTQAAMASQGVAATSAQDAACVDTETATTTSKTATSQAATASQGVAAEAATAQAATVSKQAEKMALKNYDLKFVTWEDIAVGEVPVSGDYWWV